MAAWGITNFENDVALKFVDDLVKHKVQFSIGDYVAFFEQKFDPEATSLDDCLGFFTVAELLAAIQGEPAEDLPLELKDWIESKYIKVEQSLTDQTIKVLQLLLKDSEAKEMYSDGPYYKAWQTCQKNLLKRLKA